MRILHTTELINIPALILFAISRLCYPRIFNDYHPLMKSSQTTVIYFAFSPRAQNRAPSLARRLDRDS